MTQATPIDTIKRLIQARRAHDYSAALKCYAPDAIVVLRPGEKGEGEASITAFIKGTSALALSFEAHGILESGDVALHTSQYTLDLGDKGRVSGRTADVLRRNANGNWEIVIDNAFAG
jgi:ketosteroid isomerase-like protein